MSAADLNPVARSALVKEQERLEEHIARTNREIDYLKENLRKAGEERDDLVARADQIVAALR